MKRIYLLMVLMVPLLAASKPHIEWRDTVFDFGLMSENDGPRTAEFQLTNLGSRKVLIKDVTPSCGCTKVVFPKEKIGKGATAKIKVTFDPQERPGKFDKAVYVYLNEEQKPVVLSVKGTVMASAETLQLFYPFSLGNLRLDTASVDFGELKRGVRRREFIEIYNSGSQPITPSITTSSDAVSWEITPSELKPGEKATITLFLESRKVMWLGNKELSVNLISGENKLEIPVRVFLTP